MRANKRCKQASLPLARLARRTVHLLQLERERERKTLTLWLQTLARSFYLRLRCVCGRLAAHLLPSNLLPASRLTGCLFQSLPGGLALNLMVVLIARQRRSARGVEK